MATTSISSIKPQNTIKNKVNQVLTKASLTRLENVVKGYVVDTVMNLDWINDIANATEEEADALSVAPIECTRFPSSVIMSCRESLRINFWPLNGFNTQSKLFITLETAQIRKSFSIYGSGAFRRDEPRKKFPQLETLIQGSYVPDETGVECEVEWFVVDDVPQIKLLLCTAYAGDKTKWISSPLSQNANKLVEKLNESIMKTAEGAR